MSTHKWLGNIRTCSVVRIAEGFPEPEPVGISFGFPTEPHIWTGMMDYNPYVLLAKVIK
ncbi:MAG: hypothetical protein ACK56F_26460 [bacterium]